MGNCDRFKPSNPLFNIVTKEDIERESLSDLCRYNIPDGYPSADVRESVMFLFFLCVCVPISLLC